MARCSLFLFALICVYASLLSGCALECNPSSTNVCDFKLEEALVIGGAAQAWDLNSDGADEFVVRMISGNEAGRSIQIMSSGGYVTEQVNFSGLVGPVHFADYNEDQIPEILVPFIRNDSLFVVFLSEKGEKLFQFFLIDGHPRLGDDGAIEWEWDPAIRHVYLNDLDGDNNNELISVVYTGYARNPRGIIINKLPGGQLLGKYLIGGFPSQSFFGDYDSNGKPEVVISTWAPDNGASANGFDDQHSYIVTVELTPEPVLKWSREMGGIGSNVFLMHADFNDDANAEFLALSYASASHRSETSLELIDPTSWETIQHKPINAVLRGPQVIHPYMGRKGHIVAIQDPGEIWRYDDEFEKDRSNSISTNYQTLTSVPDMDGDGVEEVVVVLPDATLYLLDGELRVKATYQGLRAIHQASTTVAQRVSRGIGEESALLLFDGNSSYILRFSRNKAAWIYRNWLAWLILICALLSLVAIQFRKTAISVQITNLFSDSERSAILSTSKHIEFINRFKDMVDNNLSDSTITVEVMAERLGVTTETMRARCKEALGVTPKRYLLLARIHRAKYLLLSTQKQIGEVSTEVGFNAPEHFSNQFKKITGHRPFEFRKKFSNITS